MPTALPLAPPCAGPATPVVAPSLHLHDVHDARRAEVEQFIRTVYAERFDARLQHFAPQLVSLRDVEGRIVAAAGYRFAGSTALFLERYLDTPIEAALARQAAATPSREGIVEVGHLAAARAGEGRRLILALGPHLAARGAQWVVSTLTEELRHLFVRIGVTPLALGVADPARLGQDLGDWGRYYEHRPVVLAGHLPAALRILARRQRGEAR